MFNRPTLTVARDLLGKFIVHRHGRRIRSAMITEVEAYKGPQDLASHARGGRRTRRVEPLYGEGGTTYVYLVYGLHSQAVAWTGLRGMARAWEQAGRGALAATCRRLAWCSSPGSMPAS